MYFLNVKLWSEYWARLEPAQRRCWDGLPAVANPGLGAEAATLLCGYPVSFHCSVCPAFLPCLQGPSIFLLQPAVLGFPFCCPGSLTLALPVYLEEPTRSGDLFLTLGY